MAQSNGSLGWIAIASEAVAYGTLGATLVYQHGIECGLKFQSTRVKPPILGSNAPHVGLQLLSHVEGPVTLGMSRSRAIIGNVYAHLASLTTNDYSFTGTPTVPSLSVFADYSGVEYDTAGCIVRGITWDLRGGADFSRITLDMIGQTQVKYAGAARTPSVPADSALTIPSGLTTFTIGGTAVGSLKSATIGVQRSVSGADRQRMGSALIPQPNIGADRPVITATFNVELNTATGDNTVAELDDLLSNTTIGDVVCSDFTLSGCYLLGEIPQLSRGFIEVPLQVGATGLVVTTTT
jgi:hypothetical protein